MTQAEKKKHLQSILSSTDTDWMLPLLDHVHDAVIVICADERVLFMNAAAERLVGLRLVEADGRPIHHVCKLEQNYKPLSRETWVATFTGEATPIIILVGPDGTATSVKITALPLNGHGGESTGYVLLLHEESDKTHVEEAFLATRANFHNVVEVTKDGIMIIDADAQIRYANPAAREFVGCEDGSLVGQDLGISTEPGEVQEIQISRASGELGVGEVRVVPTEWDNSTAYLAMP